MIYLTYLRILIGSKYEDAMASSEDPDPLGAVWSGSALFAYTCLSKNLGS